MSRSYDGECEHTPCFNDLAYSGFSKDELYVPSFHSELEFKRIFRVDGETVSNDQCKWCLRSE